MLLANRCGYLKQIVIMNEEINILEISYTNIIIAILLLKIIAHIEHKIDKPYYKFSYYEGVLTTIYRFLLIIGIIFIVIKFLHELK